MFQTRTTVKPNILASVLALAFYIFVFFPYFQITPLPIDIQPGAALFATAILMLYGTKSRLPLVIWFLLFVFACSLLVGLEDPFNLDVVRSTFGYGSLFVVAAATYLLHSSGLGPTRQFFLAVLWIWFALGVAELLAGREYFAALVLGDSTGSRGSTSWAKEPSQYATVIFMIWLVVLVRGFATKAVTALCLVQIVLVAQSAMYFVVVLGVFLLGFGASNVIFALLLAAVLVIFRQEVGDIASFVLPATRLSFVIQRLVENPINLLLFDGSVNQRAMGVFFSLKGAVDNWGLPNGFATYARYFTDNIGAYRNIFWYTENVRTIHSGYGRSLYELGFIALPVIMAPIVGIWSCVRDRKLSLLVMTVSGLAMAMLMATPIAHPIYGYIIGMTFALRDARVPESNPPKAPPANEGGIKDEHILSDGG